MSITLIAEAQEIIHATPDMTVAERYLLWIIAERARDTGREAWSGNDGWDIVEMAGISERGLRAAFVRLAKRGIEVRVPHGKDKNGRPVYAGWSAQATYRLPTLAEVIASRATIDRIGGTPVPPMPKQDDHVGGTPVPPVGGTPVPHRRHSSTALTGQREEQREEGAGTAPTALPAAPQAPAPCPTHPDGNPNDTPCRGCGEHRKAAAAYEQAAAAYRTTIQTDRRYRCRQHPDQLAHACSTCAGEAKGAQDRDVPGDRLNRTQALAQMRAHITASKTPARPALRLVDAA